MCKSIADLWQRDLRYRENIKHIVNYYFGRPGTYEDALEIDEIANNLFPQGSRR